MKAYSEYANLERDNTQLINDLNIDRPEAIEFINLRQVELLNTSYGAALNKHEYEKVTKIKLIPFLCKCVI